jgi:hypothetical protein
VVKICDFERKDQTETNALKNCAALCIGCNHFLADRVL